MSDLIYLLPLQNHILTGLRLRGRSQKDSLCLLAQFLAFFFALLHSLGGGVIIICSLVLIFLSILFLQSNTLTFVLKDTWDNKTTEP